MALNFGLLDPNAPAAIANSVTQGQQMAQQEKLGQMRMESAQLDLDKVKREAAGLQRMQQLFIENGKSPDMRTNFSEMIKSGIPHFMDIGYNGLKALDEQDRYQEFVRKSQPANTMAAPAAPTESIMRQPMGAEPTQNALGSGTYGMEATAAPVNAMAARAPVTTPAPANAMIGSQDRVAQIQRRMAELSQFPNIPAAKTELKVLEKELESAFKPHVVGGNLVGPNGNIIFTAPEKKSDFERELNAAGLTEDQKTALRRQWLAKQATHAPGTTIQLPAQEKAFESELGKGQAENLLKSKTAAQDAVSIIDTVKTGRDIMKSGMITGAGADFLVNFNQGLKTAGIDAGYADAAANSQAFTANMAGNVGKLIKQFGAGTGLSDADREFAKDMAGGRISLDAKAINKILDINERAARNVIARHNKDVKGIKTNIPLEVEMPVEVKSAPAKNVVTNPQFPGFSIGKP